MDLNFNLDMSDGQAEAPQAGRKTASSWALGGVGAHPEVATTCAGRARCVDLNLNLDKSDVEAEAQQLASRRTLACAGRARGARQRLGSGRQGARWRAWGGRWAWT